jgi:alanine-glyoxylate transaminase/serine-glyoxylate transaminase/serine-pyruvate transaminase
MSLLPENDRILLGPGPSLTSPRVMRAMAAPTLSHLDPQMLALLDDVRVRLTRTFRAADGSFAFAVSGTGTSGMETAVANLVREGTRALVVVTGYFGDRLAQMCERYGATVSRLDVEWGRACDPEALRRQLNATPADVVAMVHAETSTGVLNPIHQMAAIAREHGALTIVDAVTSLGGHPLDVGGWGIDACYSCTQKCLGGPSGLAPIVFGPRALQQRVKCRSFYFDLTLLEDYWLRRKYHHTMSSTMVYALYEALAIVEEEGLDARWQRHERNHRTLLESLSALGLSVLPRDGERLWTLNAIRVPDGIDEAAVRSHLLDEFNMEIGAGLGPLAGKIWRVGLMGASSSPRLVILLRGALERALAKQGHLVRA